MRIRPRGWLPQTEKPPRYHEGPRKRHQRGMNKKTDFAVPYAALHKKADIGGLVGRGGRGRSGCD